ncbi:hypothetical protein V2J09_013769 [Rumex salicifolius]
MPALAQTNDQLSNVTSSSYSLSCNNGFWSKHGDDITYNQLQKFWSELSLQARQDLLRIDKQTLFEHARKNMYCSRCNGLLLEVFMQIVMYGKSLQQELAGGQLSFYKLGVSKDQINTGSGENLACQDEVQDPSVHPWGGITTTKDGALTLLDCYLCSKSLKGLQNVFDSARARERERELLYPDACGGGARGWISQGMVSYGRGHGTRETCALHNARLSCDTLVDFWSALSEETRFSLLRMKEDDFVERLMYRFDSKRFCRDCRRNVIREFKELKELKRTRRIPRCTSWFCVADAAFQYEVSNDTIHVDWSHAFVDSVGKYHYFEWAVGTGEGKSDILDYENVGLDGSVQVNGLDLGGLNACYITLRAWKADGRCTELSVKAHALNGEQCVHCRLMVGDGYVTISHGETIRSFFEHAEEAEEEEDDSSMDKDGSELDDECSRPQKHAKSPELAREFLLDAATVEKAFREGTARQNAHSIFVCLALKLLEERALVACKEIETLEKQVKLLEEEENEKREEERKQRKRTKEREKKLRRKERLRGKDKTNKCSESNEASVLPDVCNEVSTTQEPDDSTDERVSESADPTASSDIQDVTSPNDYNSGLQSNGSEEDNIIGEDENDSLTAENSGLSYQNLIRQTEFQLNLSGRRADQHQSSEGGSAVYQSESQYCNDNSECFPWEGNGRNRQSRSSSTKFTFRNCGPRFTHKLQCMSNRMASRNDLLFCGCNGNNDYKAKPHTFTTRFNRDKESLDKMDSASDLLKPVQRYNRSTQNDHIRENCGRSRSKIPNHGREPLHTKKVWEPVAPQKYIRSNSDSDVTLISSSFKVSDKSGGDISPFEVTNNLPCADSVDYNLEKSCWKAMPLCNSKQAVEEEDDPCLTRSCKSSGSPDFSASSTSSSDNCSSCLSEGDCNTASPTSPIQESSSTSDSEDGSQVSEERETPVCTRMAFSEGYSEVPQETVQNKDTDLAASKTVSPLNGTVAPAMRAFQQTVIPQILNVQNIHYPFQSPPIMGYYHQTQQVPWPTALPNGILPYAHPNPYLYTPFSYTLTGESNYCMPYNAVQHLPSPLLNASQVRVYQPPHHTSSPSPFHEQKSFPTNVTGIMNLGSESKPEKTVQTESVDKQKTADFQSGNTGFSLFKFSGPVPRANSTIKPEKEALNEGFLEVRSSDLATDNSDGDKACSNKDTDIEEYKLFAASKGIEFSFF